MQTEAMDSKKGRFMESRKFSKTKRILAGRINPDGRETETHCKGVGLDQKPKDGS